VGDNNPFGYGVGDCECRVEFSLLGGEDEAVWNPACPVHGMEKEREEQAVDIAANDDNRRWVLRRPLSAPLRAPTQAIAGGPKIQWEEEVEVVPASKLRLLEARQKAAYELLDRHGAPTHDSEGRKLNFVGRLDDLLSIYRDVDPNQVDPAQPGAILHDSDKALRRYDRRDFDRFDSLCTTEFWVSMCRILRRELIWAINKQNSAKRKKKRPRKEGMKKL
jgi:hypothetical protein